MARISPPRERSDPLRNPTAGINFFYINKIEQMTTFRIATQIRMVAICSRDRATS